MGKSLCLLNLFPSIAAKQECACPSESLPRVGRGLTARNTHSIQLDKTEPGHLLVPGPVLDTRTQPWASPGVCPSRGRLMDLPLVWVKRQKGCFLPSPPRNPQLFRIYWEARILTFWGVAGRPAHPLYSVLIILTRASKGLFPTPAFPNGVPMIKAKGCRNMWRTFDAG